MVPQSFQNRWIFGNFHASLENFWTFAAGKDEGCKFYQKIFEPAPPFTLQVPERLFTILPKRFLCNVTELPCRPQSNGIT